MPLQVASPWAVGAGQLPEQLVPQKSTLVLSWHIPPQLCEPAGQTPLQAADASMHVPAQSCLPVGQAATQATPLQLTVPPEGAWQGVHEVWPQVATSSLRTHWPLHTW